MANLYSIVSEQFPEFVRANYDKFIKFIETYYEWVAEQQSVQKLSELVDIDQTANEFIIYFQNQLDILGLVSQVPQFDKKYLRLIKQLYTAKGSEQALLFLLRLNFNVDAQIQYPSQSILRTSDGNWYQESFITVERRFGSLVVDQVSSISQVFLINGTSEIPIATLNNVATQVATTNEVLSLRVFFKKTYGIGFALNQQVIIRNLQGTTIYSGVIVPSPSFVTIQNGGRDWIAGQIISIPGTSVPTTVRVKRISSIGAIEAVEIIDHGYNHSNPQYISEAAYSSRPLDAAFIATVSGTSPNRTFNLTLGDSTTVTEDVIGLARSSSSYFAEDYAAELTYAGYDQVFRITSTFTPPNYDNVPGVTFEQWLNSQATLVLNFAPVVDKKGRWLSDRSALSNTNIRLQDNFYYQQYSYVINSEVNPNVYRALAEKIHPAGMKMFTQHTLTRSYAIEPEATTSFPFVFLALTEQGSVTDTNTADVDFTVTKLLPEQILVSDLDIRQSVNKYLEDGTSGGTVSSSLFEDDGLYTEDQELYFVANDFYTSRTYHLNVTTE